MQKGKGIPVHGVVSLEFDGRSEVSNEVRVHGFNLPCRFERGTQDLFHHKTFLHFIRPLDKTSRNNSLKPSNACL
jgi:hypothetical protein